MKYKFSDLKFFIQKKGKRVDDHILGIDFHDSQVTWTDTKSKVHWDNYPEDVEIYAETK